MAGRLRLPALPLFLIATAFGVSSTIQAYSLRVLQTGRRHRSAIAMMWRQQRRDVPVNQVEPEERQHDARRCRRQSWSTRSE